MTRAPPMARSTGRGARTAPATPWAEPPSALFAALASSADGLAPREAARRLRATGPNTVRDESGPTWPALLWRQVSSPLVLILVAGAAVAMLLGDWTEAAIILVIVGGSALLGFAQEARASAAVVQLRRRLALMARVVRGGREQRLHAAAIVPGDIVKLAAGQLVPADGVVLEARDFLVTEASLTGESLPVEKRPGVLAASTALPRRSNCVWLGSSVRSGTATVLVTATGRATLFGAVAQRLAQRPPETEFARGVRQFGELLLRVMVVMVLAVIAANQWLGRPMVESLLFAVALAVGLSPELLPAIVSVTVARGARAMAKRGVIVRRLDAIENLGSIDVLCTDKTGTLTVGTVGLESALAPDGTKSDRVLALARLNAAFETGIANPLDEAIVADAKRAGVVATEGHDKVDEIPYDFQRRRLTIVVHEHGAADDRALMVTKGAFAEVLAVCTEVAGARGAQPLDRDRRAVLEARFRERSVEGFRVLAVATRRVAKQPGYTVADEAEMCFEGFLLFLDPIKPGAKEAVADLAHLGIAIKVITGDNRHVAAHVAAALGLPAAQLLTGEQLAAMRDEALWHQVRATTVFAEVDPQQKEHIVRALQRTGHAVGYLGDGINDAPSLHAADVGISVDDAVDVARDSADIVLLKPDLAVLRRGVEDGRGIFANTLKYIGITTSSNFGNMISMAIGTLYLPFLPLLAKQILLNNFLSDLPSFAISTDRVDAARIATPQRWDVRAVRRFMVAFGLTSTAFDLLTFAWLSRITQANEATFQTAWFVISLWTELAIVMVLRTREVAWRSLPSRPLAIASGIVAVAALATPYLPSLQRWFGFVPLAPTLVLALLAIVALYLACAEALKRRIGAA